MIAERVAFAGSWQAKLAGFGFESFGDFFDYGVEKRINVNTKRDVSILTLGQGAGEKVFFMKRFHRPHYKDMLFTVYNFGRLCSQAAIEWENANLLFENGVSTYKPVCYGEQIRWGLERKSFFVTEKLQRQCFTDFVAENWAQLGQAEREKIIVTIAKLVRKVHDAKIGLPDLYVWHLFISRTKEGDYEFAVIDLHRMKRNITNKNERMKSLGRLTHSMVDKYFSDGVRRLLVEAYAGDDWPGGVEKLIGQVEKQSQRVSAQRNPKPY